MVLCWPFMLYEIQWASWASMSFICGVSEIQIFYTSENWTSQSNIIAVFWIILKYTVPNSKIEVSAIKMHYIFTYSRMNHCGLQLRNKTSALLPTCGPDVTYRMTLEKDLGKIDKNRNTSKWTKKVV